MPQLSRTVTAWAIGALLAGFGHSEALARGDDFEPEQVVQDDATFTIDAPVIVTTGAGREVVLYREDNRARGAVLVAATRDSGDTQWSRPTRLTGKGVVAFAAVATPAGRVVVGYRFHRPGSSVVTTRLRTLGRAGRWGAPETLATERVPQQTGVETGFAFDVGRHGSAVAAWPTHRGVRVVVRRPGGTAGTRDLFPRVDSAALAHISPTGSVDVVGTRVGDRGPSGVVLHRAPDGGWQRACFVNCSGPHRPLAVTSVSSNDRGALAVAWTHPSSRGITSNVRALVRFRTASGHWSPATVLAKQATSGAQVDLDASGRAAVSWASRPPHRDALRLAYHRPDGRWFGDRVLGSRRPSVAGDPAPVVVDTEAGSTLLVYEQVRRFAAIDQVRAAVRQCRVGGACHPWRWVPTPSTDVDAARLPLGAASVIWADGCTVVFENCFFKRIAGRRLVPGP